MKKNLRHDRKKHNKDQLLSQASLLLRQQGMRRLSVESVMNSIGLTRGSFYVYFKNKKDMIMQAFKYAVNFSNHHIEDYLSKHAQDPQHTFDTFINFYLSEQHRDTSEGGCPISALAQDFSSATPEEKRLFAEQLSFLFESRRRLIKKHDHILTREEWIGVTCVNVGALILSRATEGTQISDEILSAARNFLNYYSQEPTS